MLPYPNDLSKVASAIYSADENIKELLEVHKSLIKGHYLTTCSMICTFQVFLCMVILHSCYLPCRLILYRYVACLNLYLGGFLVVFKIHFENPYNHIRIYKLCEDEENMTLFMVLTNYILYSAKFWQRHQQTEENVVEIINTHCCPHPYQKRNQEYVHMFTACHHLNVY